MALAITPELAALVQELKPLFQGLSAALRDVAARLATLTAALPRLQPPSPSPAVPAAPDSQPAPGGEAPQSSPPAGKEESAGAALAKVLVPFTLLKRALGDVIGQAGKFVEALDPSAMELFGDVTRDLQAVIGTALLPIIEVATDAFREVGDILVPVMQELAGPVREIATAVKNILIPIVQVFAQVLSGQIAYFQAVWAPIIEAVAVIFRALVAVVSAVVRSLVTALGSLFGANLGNLANDFKSAVRSMTTALVVGVGRLLAFLGATDVLRNYIQALEGGPKGNSAGAAAIQNVRQVDLSGIVKDLQVAAAGATGGGDTGPEKDPIAEAVAQLKQIASSTDRTTLSEVIASGVAAGLSRLPAAGAAAVYEGVESHLDDWGTVLGDLFSGGEIERRRPIRRR